jgi:hypothetical protein
MCGARMVWLRLPQSTEFSYVIVGQHPGAGLGGGVVGLGAAAGCGIGAPASQPWKPGGPM